MKHRRNAILWAIGWWIVRRQIRQRTAVALADVGASAGAAARRGRFRSVLGAIVLVGVIAAGFVAVRKLVAGGAEPGSPASLDGRVSGQTVGPTA